MRDPSRGYRLPLMVAPLRFASLAWAEDFRQASRNTAEDIGVLDSISFEGKTDECQFPVSYL